jgi:hypothetical protein
LLRACIPSRGPLPSNTRHNIFFRATLSCCCIFTLLSVLYLLSIFLNVENLGDLPVFSRIALAGISRSRGYNHRGNRYWMLCGRLYIFGSNLTENTCVCCCHFQYSSKYQATEEWQLLSTCNKSVAEPQKLSGFKRASCTSALLAACFRLVSWLDYSSTWRRRRHVTPKCLLIFYRLHCVISQKTEFFITTAVRTSNLTRTSFVTSVHVEGSFPLHKFRCCKHVARLVYLMTPSAEWWVKQGYERLQLRPILKYYTTFT